MNNSNSRETSYLATLKPEKRFQYCESDRVIDRCFLQWQVSSATGQKLFVFIADIPRQASALTLTLRVLDLRAKVVNLKL